MSRNRRILALVHDRVRQAAADGVILDAYRLADELIAADAELTPRRAVDTVIAAGVVYGACLVLDPPAAARPPAPKGPANDGARPRETVPA